MKNIKIGLLTDTSRHTNGRILVGMMFVNSPLFRYSYDYCKKHCDEIYVLSAKYGLIDVREIIDSYNEDINYKSKKEMDLWLESVVNQIRKTISKGSELYFHTGRRYRTLIPFLRADYKCFEPFKGLGLGEKLQKYKKMLNKNK